MLILLAKAVGVLIGFVVVGTLVGLYLLVRGRHEIDAIFLELFGKGG